MRLLLCYVHPKTLASREGHDYPLGEVSIFVEFTERYPADVDMRLVPWPMPKAKKAPRELRGGVGGTAVATQPPSLVDALIAHLSKAGEPALVLPSYHLAEADMDRLVAFCLANGHIPFLCSEMLLSATKRATDAYLWREMDRLVAKLKDKPATAACDGNCAARQAETKSVPVPA
jgi:hypothetical protein